MRIAVPVGYLGSYQHRWKRQLGRLHARQIRLLQGLTDR